MAKKETSIVIKKIQGGGHGGHHGGAWKVAYADFVTAMMAFFLVMWLMGADEETKSSIAHYFNHPNTPYNAGRDPASNEAHPLGERAGSGENVLNGLNGAVPEDLVQNPLRSQSEQVAENKQMAELMQEVLDGKLFDLEINISSIKFSVPEKLFFKENSLAFEKGADKYLDRLGQVLKGYQGKITIDAHSNTENSYEFSMSRAVNIMNYFITRKWIPEERMFPVGSGARRKIASDDTEEGRDRNRRIEFTVARK